MRKFDYAIFFVVCVGFFIFAYFASLGFQGITTRSVADILIENSNGVSVIAYDNTLLLEKDNMQVTLENPVVNENSYTFLTKNMVYLKDISVSKAKIFVKHPNTGILLKPKVKYCPDNYFLSNGECVKWQTLYNQRFIEICKEVNDSLEENKTVECYNVTEKYPKPVSADLEGYQLEVNNFSAYSIEPTGDFTNLAACLDYLAANDTSGTCMIVASGSYEIGKSVTYALTDPDNDGIIFVDADNVILDCDDSTIDGNDNGYGIFIAPNHTDITIKNCKINDFYYGIYGENLTSLEISNNEISSIPAYGYGIYLKNPEDALIDYNYIHNGGGYSDGIRISRAKYITILNNTIQAFSGGTYGIALTSNHTTVINNTLDSIGGYAITFGFQYTEERTENITLLNNKVFPTLYVRFFKVDNSRLENNIINSTYFQLSSCKNFTLQNNSFDSIILIWGYYNHVISTNNNVAGRPIYYNYSIENHVYENLNAGHIQCAYCRNITIVNSNVTKSFVSIDYTNDSIIENSFVNNTYHGVKVRASNNIIIENLSINSAYGIWLGGSQNVTLLLNNISATSYGLDVNSGPFTENEIYYRHTIPTNNYINSLPVYYNHSVTNYIFDGLNTSHLECANCTNITIQNCNISIDGMELKFVKNSTIKNNYVSNTTYLHSPGIYIYGSGNLIITNNTLESPLAGNGIWIGYSSGSGKGNITIENNIIYKTGGSWNGIEDYVTSDVVIKNNNITRNVCEYYASAINLRLGTSVAENNTVYGCIVTRESSHVIANNTIYAETYGIWLITAGNNLSCNKIYKTQQNNYEALYIEAGNLNGYNQNIDDCNTINDIPVKYSFNSTSLNLCVNEESSHLACILCENLTINNCTVTNNDKPNFLYITNSIINNSNFTNNIQNLKLENSENVTIDNCYLSSTRSRASLEISNSTNVYLNSIVIEKETFPALLINLTTNLTIYASNITDADDIEIFSLENSTLDMEISNASYFTITDSRNNFFDTTINLANLIFENSENNVLEASANLLTLNISQDSIYNTINHSTFYNSSLEIYGCCTNLTYSTLANSSYIGIEGNSVNILHNTISETSNYGISLYANNSLIKNNTLLNTKGLYCRTINSTIEDNNITRDTIGEYGIYVENTLNSNFTNNTISGVGTPFIGIYISNSNSCRITSNKVSGGRSIFLSNSKNLFLAENNISTSYIGLKVNSYSAWWGYFNHTILTSNTINGLPVYYNFSASDFTLENINASHVECYLCSNYTIENSNISDDGLIVRNSTKIFVLNNTIDSKNENYYIYFNDISDLLVQNNIISTLGIWIESFGKISRNLNIENNTFQPSTDYPIYIYNSDYVFVKSNSIINTTLYPIEFDYTNNSEISNNYIEVSDTNAISLDGTYNLTISNNRILLSDYKRPGVSKAIYSTSEGIKILNNTIILLSNRTQGIRTSGCINVSENNITGPEFGKSAPTITGMENLAENCEVSYNIFENLYKGLFGGYSIAYQNRFENNYYGVYFTHTNDTLYHNFFINNTIHAYAISGNYFNITGSAKGNYWDDIVNLNITDSDGDGYGDSGSDYPYSNATGGKVSENVVDYGPLMQPFVPSYTVRISLTPSSDITVYRGQTIDVSCSATNTSSLEVRANGTLICSGKNACSGTYTPESIGQIPLVCEARGFDENYYTKSITITVRRRSTAGGVSPAPAPSPPEEEIPEEEVPVEIPKPVGEEIKNIIVERVGSTLTATIATIKDRVAKLRIHFVSTPIGRPKPQIDVSIEEPYEAEKPAKQLKMFDSWYIFLILVIITLILFIRSLIAYHEK